MSRSLVCLHAHPDDEALLTAGTLARAVAEGHRVTLVVATDGEAGLAEAGPGGQLAAQRVAELAESAQALGVHRIVRLGYPDSGMVNEHAGFAALDPAGPARRLGEVLAEESADLLLGYDSNGGYGHPDHVQVHRVARAAAALTGVRLLEATVDRTALMRALWLVHRSGLAPADFAPERMRQSYAPRSELTHRVNVRRFLNQKRASMRAHTSQAGGGTDTRTLAFCLRLPRPAYRLAFGSEWFIEPGRPSPSALIDDIWH
ncbi:MAG TPA: PIG-L family deacetylase [Jatrophihabitans sp.]|nr:PIG-L family deacetylase [Jatrophihabitans sp.]